MARRQHLAGQLPRHIPVEQDDLWAEGEDTGHEVRFWAEGAKHLEVGLLLEQEYERIPYMCLGLNHDNAHNHP